ncbi:LPS-assembly protein LptD [Reinekea sp.]|uniref:LPS-assembly protein LptD n=1 Tax=Reinekea sp. TaxID=1970455 RepID=UPI0039893BBA
MKLHYRALAVAITSYTTVSYAETVVDIDWVEMNNLPAQESRYIAPYCTGGFVAPELSVEPTTRVFYDRADTQNDGTGVFYGDVSLTGENLSAQSDQLSYDRSTELASLTGSALIRFPGFALSSDQAEVSTLDNHANADQTNFVIHDNDMHGSAAYMSRDEAYTFAKNVKLTRCAPTDNAWSLKSSSMTIDNEKRYAKAWHTQLRVQGIPVFYWPYVSFPLDDQRFTGFLTPTFGFAENDQFLSELRLPFYINLAPNYDDTLTFHYLGNQGSLFDNEFRFLTPNHNGVNSFAFLAIPAEEITAGQEDPNRWNIQHRQSGKFNSTTGYNFTTNWVSDVNYEQAFAAKTEATHEQTFNAKITNQAGKFKNTLALDYVQPVADSAPNTYLFKKYHSTVGTQFDAWQTSLYGEFHTLYDAQDRPATAAKYELKRQPELNVNHRTNWFDSFTTKEQVRLAYFDRNLTDELKSTLTSSDVWLNNSTQRMHGQVELSKPFIERWGYFKPSVTGYYTGYQTSNELFNDFPTSDAATADAYTDRALWSATFDQGLTFESQGTNINTTLSPRLHYTYTPFAEQNNAVLETTEASDYALFQTTRFDSIDRLGDINRLSTSISSKFATAADDRAFATLSLAKGVKLSQERITLTDPLTPEDTAAEFSPWQVSASFTPSDAFKLTTRWDFGHDDLELGDYSVNASYQPEDKVFTSLNATQEGFEREIGFASYFPVRPNIALIGYAIAENNEQEFSVENYKFKEFVYGIDYDSCCWSVRLAGYNTAVEDDQSDTFFPLETNKGVYFEFTLKGIGASFGTIEDFLTNLNIGYSGKMFNYK